MPSEKSTAIVLRLVEFSETSLIVTLLTRDFGKITALAKGARRRKNSFESALDLLSICRIVFLLKSSGAMDLLTEAKLDRRFRSAAKDLDRLYAGYYVAELLRCLTDDHDPHPNAYELAVATLTGIDESYRIVPALFEFEISLLTILGHQPVFSSCAGCGKEKTEDKRVSFGLNEGGVLCHGCRVGKQNIVSLSHEAWAFLNRLNLAVAAENDRSEPHYGFAQDWHYEEIPTGEVRKVMNQYISHLLGYRPRLHSIIESL